MKNCARAPRVILKRAQPAPPADPTATSTPSPQPAQKSSKKPGPSKGIPKRPGPGRKLSTKNLTSYDIREVARQLVCSVEYRTRLKEIIDAGGNTTMQVLLHHYAFGKPAGEPIEPEGERKFMVFLSRYPLGTKDPLEAEMRAIGQGSEAKHTAVKLAEAKVIDHDPSTPGGLIEVDL